MPGLLDALGAPYTPGLQLVDPACPVNWSHPLAGNGLVALFRVVCNPGWSGGLTFRDLVSGGRNPHDGTINGTVGTGVKWQGAKGRRGGAGSLLFDGSTGYVEAGSGSLVTVPLTLACWVNIGAVASGSKTFFAIDEPGFSTSSVRIQATSSGYVGNIAGNSVPVQATAATAYTANTWHHLAVTGSAGLVATLFVDGVQKASSTAATGTPQACTNFNIGALHTTSVTNFANAYIDECVAWNRVLSATEIMAWYQSSVLGHPELLNYLGTTAYSFPATGGSTIVTCAPVSGWPGLASPATAAATTATPASDKASSPDTSTAATPTTTPASLPVSAPGSFTAVAPATTPGGAWVSAPSPSTAAVPATTPAQSAAAAAAATTATSPAIQPAATSAAAVAAVALVGTVTTCASASSWGNATSSKTAVAPSATPAQATASSPGPTAAVATVVQPAGASAFAVPAAPAVGLVVTCAAGSSWGNVTAAATATAPAAAPASGQVGAAPATTAAAASVSAPSAWSSSAGASAAAAVGTSVTCAPVGAWAGVAGAVAVVTPPSVVVPEGLWSAPPLVFTWAAPPLTFLWTVPAAAGRSGTVAVSDIPLVTLRRFPEWTPLTWGFEFRQLPQLVAGQTIALATVAVLSGDLTLTLGTAAVSGTQVLFDASGGTAGQSALIVCTVTLSSGKVISWRGLLFTSN